jgi:hypothetical protein
VVDAPNGKRSQMYGQLTKLVRNGEHSQDVKDQIIWYVASALLAVVDRHKLTDQKFSGAIICEGCGELVGPNGALCEELQGIWDVLDSGEPG